MHQSNLLGEEFEVSTNLDGKDLQLWTPFQLGAQEADLQWLRRSRSFPTEQL